MAKNSTAGRQRAKAKATSKGGSIGTQKGGNAGTQQKGRQHGSQTGRESFKTNSQEFFRHPGQGMRGKQGGQRERGRGLLPGKESTGSDTRKHTRPKSER